MELVLHPDCFNCKHFNNGECMKQHDLSKGIKRECNDFEVDLQINSGALNPNSFDVEILPL